MNMILIYNFDMAKVRIIVFLITIVVVGTVLYVASLYARGYRFNPQTLKFIPNGLLIIKSVPDGAQLFINGEFKTATNTTLPLPPGTYDIRVEKEGFWTWSKRMTIEKEVVTESTAHLFKIAPSLSAITFSGVAGPLPSIDNSKLVYAVPTTTTNNNNSGLWILESVNLPLGFSRDPKRITDADTLNAQWLWSPDSREIMLTTPKAVFLLDTGAFTPQSKLVNVTTRKTQILAHWQEEKEKRLNAQMKKIPSEVQDILKRKASQVVFSPDEDMVLYSASASASIANNLIPQLPGSSSQKENREVKNGNTYVYDIIEDRNFLISELPVHLHSWSDYSLNPKAVAKSALSWYFSTRHVI